ncbi:hypothetical protein Tco_0894909 [Tanacetum coccineum]|uniref:Reverse transcriptase domain-containing protein n=1 Tax=Tanacetum coccineum TaxID=301880 RepID=A0ABQ5CFG4_9ASTR
MKMVNTFVAMSSEKRAVKEQQQESPKRQKLRDDKETDEHEEVEADNTAELKKHLVIKKDDDIAIDVYGHLILSVFEFGVKYSIRSRVVIMDMKDVERDRLIVVDRDMFVMFERERLNTPLCCDDIHDVTPRVSTLAGCDKLVSEPLVIENILVMFSPTRKKSRWGTIFPTGLERYKEPLVEPKEIGYSLIPLSCGSFDVIVGMDWLSKRKFVIVCHEKVVRIPLEGDEILQVHGKRTQGVMKTLMNTKVEFRIDLVHGATSVAKSLYRLAPLEMQELSEQLQELKDKGKANVVIEALRGKEQVKPRRVRAMAMTIKYGVRGMILAAQSEAFKQENGMMRTVVIDEAHASSKEWNSGDDQLRLRWMIYLVVLADDPESVKDAIRFVYCLTSSSGWTKSPVLWAEIGESSLIGPELVQETTDKVVIDVIDKILEEDFDALLDERSEIFHSIKGTILKEKLFAEFDEFMAINIKENSESESETKELPFKKITFNTEYKIKASLEEPHSDLELKPLPGYLEYVFLEEPNFLPVIISSQLSKQNSNKLISILKRHKQAFAWKTTDILGICLSFCKHKIQLLEDKKPIVQKQR